MNQIKNMFGGSSVSYRTTSVSNVSYITILIFTAIILVIYYLVTPDYLISIPISLKSERPDHIVVGIHALIFTLVSCGGLFLGLYLPGEAYVTSIIFLTIFMALIFYVVIPNNFITIPPDRKGTKPNQTVMIVHTSIFTLLICIGLFVTFYSFTGNTESKESTWSNAYSSSGDTNYYNKTYNTSNTNNTGNYGYYGNSNYSNYSGYNNNTSSYGNNNQGYYNNYRSY